MKGHIQYKFVYQKCPHLIRNSSSSSALKKLTPLTTPTPHSAHHLQNKEEKNSTKRRETEREKSNFFVERESKHDEGSE